MILDAKVVILAMPRGGGLPGAQSAPEKEIGALVYSLKEMLRKSLTNHPGAELPARLGCGSARLGRSFHRGEAAIAMPRTKPRRGGYWSRPKKGPMPKERGLLAPKKLRQDCQDLSLVGFP